MLADMTKIIRMAGTAVVAVLLAACTSSSSGSTGSNQTMTQTAGTAAVTAPTVDASGQMPTQASESTSSSTPATAGTGSAAAGPRPNFVFVLTDDLAWNLVSHMPHVQALQQAGTTMSGYYVVDSLCCPSRSAIFTGEYPHDDGVFTNMGKDGGYSAYNNNGDEQKSFALALQQAGYRTGFMGKYLNGYEPTDPVPPG